MTPAGLPTTTPSPTVPPEKLLLPRLKLPVTVKLVIIPVVTLSSPEPATLGS